MKHILIKICGITDCQDAILAANLGADLIGVNMSPRSPRYTDLQTAKDIAKAVREHGAQCVAVFVDENYEQMKSTLEHTGIHIAQLHGKGSHAAANDISRDYETILAVPFDREIFPLNGKVKVLFDNLNGGSGKAFDWNDSFIEKSRRAKEWILAGGLNASNVVEAIRLLKPTGVDVMGGVADRNSDRLRRKDPEEMQKFIALVRGTEHE